MNFLSGFVSILDLAATQGATGSQPFTAFGPLRTKVEGANAEGGYVITMEGIS